MKIHSKIQIKDWLPRPFLNRKIHSKLYSSLELPEVTILYGPRQVGKSAQVSRCIEQIFDQKSEADVFYFNLDYPTTDFENPDRFLNAVQAEKKQSDSLTYIFLDEAQRLNNVGLFVKYIYDQHKNIKFFLTGSASLEIKQKIKEPLTGRKIEFFLPPMGLDEILESKGILTSNIQGPFDQTDQVLNEFLLYGGYPSVVVARSLEEKVRKISEIANSYVIRDVASMFGITSETELRMVTTYLAENIGGIFSKEGLSRLAGISKYEVDKIVTALEKSFIIFLVRPFSQNPAKEMVHRPKVYFLDPGVRNVFLSKTEPGMIINDKGKLFENSIAIQLRNTLNNEHLKYWRTKGQTEVDFVGIYPGGRIKAFETKFTSFSNTSGGLESFKMRYGHLLDESRLIVKDNYWTV